jgi:hypothetical protein
MLQEKNLNTYSNRIKERSNNLKFCLKKGAEGFNTSPTREGLLDFVWNVEGETWFIPKNLDTFEMGIVDVLLDFFNKGRIFNLSTREIENYLRDENHIKAIPESEISEKLLESWIRELIKGYYSCNVPQREFQGDFAKLDLIQKIKAVKELLKEVHFKKVNVDLVDIEYPELVFKLETNQLVERPTLEGFSAFLQAYLRRYFKNEELVVQIEKNL